MQYLFLLSGIFFLLSGIFPAIVNRQDDNNDIYVFDKKENSKKWCNNRKCDIILRNMSKKGKDL